jgi:MoxR-like ATPase
VTDDRRSADAVEASSAASDHARTGVPLTDDWRVFRRDATSPHDRVLDLPEPPPWRRRRGAPPADQPHAADGSWRASVRGQTFQADEGMERMVNAALYLRRPLLITGRPGTGKSSLIEAVAWQLGLGPVLRWPVTSRSTLQQALYSYDAIGRLQEVQLRSGPRSKAPVPEIGKYITLGPLGTAMVPRRRPRPLLIDEIDKSDIDLPNDLLNVLEDGEFEIPELARLDSTTPVGVRLAATNEIHRPPEGKVECWDFPFVVMTSNGERDFPPAFLRRCLRLEMREPTAGELGAIIEAHLGDTARASAAALVSAFFDRRSRSALATDQLLNSVFLVIGRPGLPETTRAQLIELIWQELAASPQR